jgi:hypothetical protein
MAESGLYPWTQRTIDRATLWSFSRLLAAALWLAARIRRNPGGDSVNC